MKTEVISIRGTKFPDMRYDTPDYVYIGRPSIWGNPYTIGVNGTREEVIEKFKKYFEERIAGDKFFRSAVLHLRGKKLGCFCSPLACHGDIYVAWLNANPNEVQQKC